MNGATGSAVDGNEEDEDKNDATIHLFEQEERDFIEIRLTAEVASVLRLRQFGSHDDRWGIHSTVWDGGIALLQYVATHYEPIRQLIPHRVEVSDESSLCQCRCTDAVYVLDLGSGTGITGLGIAALTNGQCRVALTDLPEALPLLQDNLHLNAKFWQENLHLNAKFWELSSQAPIVGELTWGNRTSLQDWLSEFLDATDKSHDFSEASSSPIVARSRGIRRVLVTGADIVYRPSLFAPLLMTLTDLYSQLHEIATVDVLLSCQSVRSHLNEFWEAAARCGFSTRMIAVARMRGDEIQDLSQIVVDAVSDDTGPPFTTFPIGLGISWIVALTKN
jgi:Lysine methyltransferase